MHVDHFHQRSEASREDFESEDEENYDDMSIDEELGADVAGNSEESVHVHLELIFLWTLPPDQQRLLLSVNYRNPSILSKPLQTGSENRLKSLRRR